MHFPQTQVNLFSLEPLALFMPSCSAQQYSSAAVKHGWLSQGSPGRFFCFIFIFFFPRFLYFSHEECYWNVNVVALCTVSVKWKRETAFDRLEENQNIHFILLKHTFPPNKLMWWPMIWWVESTHRDSLSGLIRTLVKVALLIWTMKRQIISIIDKW